MHEEIENYIPLDRCEHRHVYDVRSRNLYGKAVFDKQVNGFVGIREKFDHEYLDTEYHWDTGPPHGTAKPLQDLGELPEEIEPFESLGVVECATRRPVRWDEQAKIWRYVDTGEAPADVSVTSVPNRALFEFLKS